MFTTFSSDSGPAARRNGSSAPRAKRSQVARACDWCRLNRVKCDDRVPCRNCENRGGNCTHSRSKDLQTLMEATRENKHLEARLRDLEEQLKQAKAREAEVLPATPSSLRLKDFEERLNPSQAREAVVPPTISSLSNSTIQSNSAPPGARDDLVGAKEQERGGQLGDGKALSISYRGASTVAYFVTRINCYLEESLKEPHDPRRLEPVNASATLASPASTLKRGARPEFGDGVATQFTLQELDRHQEEMFLNLFWHHHHLLYPIISEADFEEHYESLWVDLPSDRPSIRRSSPLIDAMIAICMQHGTMVMKSNGDAMDFNGDFPLDDATIAGRGYHVRCQRLLEYELETPSVTTLQCLLLSTIFLWDASFVNQADHMLAVTVRVAYTLGLDKRPPDDLAPGLKSLYKRLWSAVYVIDTSISIAVGRPFLTHITKATYPNGEDSRNDAKGYQVRYTDQNNAIGLYEYLAQSFKLASAVRAAFALLDARCQEFVDFTDLEEMQRDPKFNETLASLMPKAMEEIDKWTEEVPALLRGNSSSSSKPFSPYRSSIGLDDRQPAWLQSQRIHLILQYHEYVMLLFRPFIRIPPVAVSLTPLSDDIVISCHKHSVAVTSIIQQVSSETDVIKSCHQAYRTQWNAALTNIGWVLGNPLCQPTPAARKALQTAAFTLDGYGNSIAFAKSAATIVRDMNSLIPKLIPYVRTDSRLSAQKSSAPSNGSNTAHASRFAQPLAGNFSDPPLDSTPKSANLFEDMLQDSMDSLWPSAGSMPMTIPNLFSIDPQLIGNAMPETWDSTTDVR